MDNDIITTESPADDEEFLRCMQYLQWREVDSKLTKVQIANRFGVHRNTLNGWLIKWENSGLLRRCRQVFLKPRVEEIQNAVDAILDDWPNVLMKQLQTAKNGKSEKISLEAAIWLHEAIVQPAIEAKEDEGQAEMIYIQSKTQVSEPFNPLALIEDKKASSNEE